MCSTCGCSENHDGIKILMPGEENGHHQAHNHHHEHSHEHTVTLEKNILHENDLLAERNRGYFMAKNITAINLVSSPGSGKTSLLEATLAAMKDEINMYVIEGDQQTFNDANRIKALDIPVVQINTGKGCHLDAHMILHALEKLNPAQNSIVFIENVGNLVCPALFDLGENERVVIMSVTEGDDKPLKYPNMFESSSVCVINKTDLLPYVQFDMQKAKAYAHRVNPHLQFFETDVLSGQGLSPWINWLKNKISVQV